ncbi:hypothetical protein Sjap_017465 [Stephania japonica]|uniref:Uncharacterized protein n=1 Tax=Stephania japonica TaxID=461633 RepID=A0AAP0NKE2_9MAGN
MASKFRRTLSSPTAANRKPTAPQKACHVRSVSLPCRSHPLISHIDAEIRDLQSWTATAGDRSSAWIRDGLGRLKSLHDSVEDLLLLPQSRDSLSRRSDVVENLLEDYLSFADLYCRFREALAAYREDKLTAQIYARRRDQSRAVDLCGRARKVFEKEVIKMLDTVRSMEMVSASASVTVSDDDPEQPDVAGILRGVREATAAVTGRVFGGMCRSRVGNYYKGWMEVVLLKMRVMKSGGGGDHERVELCEEVDVVDVDDDDDEVERLCGLGKWGEVLVRMREVEIGVLGIETQVERVFNSLIGTRVNLLNVLTQNTCCC